MTRDAINPTAQGMLLAAIRLGLIDAIDLACWFLEHDGDTEAVLDDIDGRADAAPDKDVRRTWNSIRDAAYYLTVYGEPQTDNHDKSIAVLEKHGIARPA